MERHVSFRDTQRLAIDKKLADGSARADEETRILKVRRNEVAPIAILPDDILTSVFLLVRGEYDTEPANWHAVAHICSYWRQVAISSPSLWTVLNNPTYPYTLLMLERSRNAPLHIMLDGDDTPVSTLVLTAVLQEIERIRLLHFSYMPSNTLAEAQLILGDRRALVLEDLLLNFDDDSNGHIAESTDRVAMAVLRPNLLIVRKLHMATGSYDWDFLGTLVNLTHLDLDYSVALGGCTANALFHALRNLQNLERLKINVDCMVEAEFEEFPPTSFPQPVCLPRLKFFGLDDASPAHIEAFLSLLTFPRLCQVEIHGSHNVINPRGLLQSLLSLLDKGDFRKPEFLRIMCGTRGCGLNIAGAPWDKRYSFDNRYLDIQFGRNYWRADESAICTTTDIVSCVNRYTTKIDGKLPVRHLCLVDKWVLTTSEFVREFGHLPHLESIQVDAGDREITILIDALASRQSSPEINAVNSDGATTDSDDQPSFPKLTTITWRGEFGGTALQDVPPLAACVFKRLQICFATRFEQGVPIVRLNLMGCPVLDDRQRAILAELGVQVTETRKREDLSN